MLYIRASRPASNGLSRAGARWPGPVRGAALGRLVSPHHTGDASTRLSSGGALAALGAALVAQLASSDALIPLTIPEVRRLVYRLVVHTLAPPDMLLHGSRWRRLRQARAMRSHYRR